MPVNPESLRPIGYDHIPPDPGGEIRALARIGYSLQEALADIIDNSVDARARHVLVRLFHTPDAVSSIAIADDGTGMTAARLKEAMQFGAQTAHAKTDLGLYGMGLKTASFSQCRQVAVFTRSSGRSAGRSWSDEEIRKGWQCGILADDACDAVLGQDWSPVTTRSHGTVIVWDRIREAYEGKNGCVPYLRGLFPRLALHLGLCFHRIISAGRLSLTIDAMQVAGGASELTTVVKPIDPFAYPQTGNKYYPAKFTFDLGGLGMLPAVAHVWPPKSKAIEYRLGGEAAAKQGFYFYRNERLIQAGGWNGVRKDAGEPHFSLARVQIDLPPSLDSEFGLTTQKSGVEVPDVFRDAVLGARAGALAWNDFIKDANAAYRRAPPRPKVAPVLPGTGAPAAVRKRAGIIGEGGKRFAIKVSFRWAKLPPDRLFDVDRDEKAILLNAAYRKVITREPATDLLKTLLFLLLQDEVRMARAMKQHDKTIREWNDLLIATLEA